MNEKNRRKYPILLAAAVLIPVTVYGYITETVQKNEKKLSKFDKNISFLVVCGDERG